MTLIDYETGKQVINPFITLYTPDTKYWVSVNTQTFGEEGQTNLVHILDESTQIRLRRDEQKQLYKVVAAVSKQNWPMDYYRKDWGRTVRCEGADDALALIPLGYLLEDVVAKLFPNSFAYFEKQGVKELAVK